MVQTQLDVHQELCQVPELCPQPAYGLVIITGGVGDGLGPQRSCSGLIPGSGIREHSWKCLGDPMSARMEQELITCQANIASEPSLWALLAFHVC